jgi:hypothetical protein
MARAKGRKRKRSRKAPQRTVTRVRRTPIIEVDGSADASSAEPLVHGEHNRILTGGDIDADVVRADASGEEAVGGSTAMPDQDVVDEICRALGVEIPDEAELRTSNEILAQRDRLRWHLEREAEDEEDGRPHQYRKRRPV